MPGRDPREQLVRTACYMAKRAMFRPIDQAHRLETRVQALDVTFAGHAGAYGGQVERIERTIRQASAQCRVVAYRFAIDAGDDKFDLAGVTE